jgi:hypothetical protein
MGVGEPAPIFLKGTMNGCDFSGCEGGRFKWRAVFGEIRTEDCPKCSGWTEPKNVSAEVIRRGKEFLSWKKEEL